MALVSEVVVDVPVVLMLETHHHCGCAVVRVAAVVVGVSAVAALLAVTVVSVTTALRLAGMLFVDVFILVVSLAVVDMPVVVVNVVIGGCCGWVVMPCCQCSRCWVRLFQR